MTVEPGHPCPTCGKTVREAVEARMGQMRARTLLVSELANYDLSASVKAEILAGTRLLADVLDEHDRKNAPQE